MALLIKTDDSVTTIEPENKKYFVLEELQSLVGGFIEVVYLADNSPMIINEEGKLLDLPHNPKATVLLKEAGGIPGDWIAGDAVVIQKPEEFR